MSPVALRQLGQMQEAASRQCGRRWTPGEIAWAFLTGPAEQRVRFFGTGWAWKQPDYLVVLAADPETALEALAWAGDVPVEVPTAMRPCETLCAGRGPCTIGPCC
jgi:hypothetical protein